MLRRTVLRCSVVVLFCLVFLGCGVPATTTSTAPAVTSSRAGSATTGVEFAVGDENQALALIAVKVGKLYGYINTAGQMVVKPRYEDASDVRENGFAPVRLDGKWGFVDDTGCMVIEANYEFAGVFQEGLACVVRNGLTGYIDETGADVIPPTFEGGLDFQEGMVNIGIDGMRGFADRTGRMVIGAKFAEVADGFREGVAWVWDTGGVLDTLWGLVRGDAGRVGFVDSTGRYVIDPVFYDAWGPGFSEGLAAMQDDSQKVGFIDHTGCWVIPPTYDDVSIFSEGLAFVNRGEEFGFVDHAGDLVIRGTLYHRAHDFHDGLAAALLAPDPPVSRNEEIELPEKWGYIDKTGVYVIQPQLRLAGDFADGFAHVWFDDEREGVIDTEGRVIWQAP